MVTEPRVSARGSEKRVFIALLSKSPIASRLKFAAVDMLPSVPPADIYILKTTIHDWNDAQCIPILRNCRENMRDDGRVI